MSTDGSVTPTYFQVQSMKATFLDDNNESFCPFLVQGFPRSPSADGDAELPGHCLEIASKGCSSATGLK